MSHIIDPATLSVVNLTMNEQHALYPGWVLRKVETKPDGTIYINSFGAGTGSNPFNLNVFLANPLWGGNVNLRIKEKIEEEIEEEQN